MTIKEYLIENNIEHLWGSKNELPPDSYTCGSHKKIWIKCLNTEYHGEYLTTCSHFYTGRRCPYCSHYLVHPKDSFGQYLLDNFGENAILLYWSNKNSASPFNVAKSSTKKYFIKCQNKVYHPDYEIRCCDFIKGSRCPCCGGKKIHPKDSFAQWGCDNIGNDFLNKYWSNKNKINPYKIFKNSGMYIYIKCQNYNYHDDYKVRVADFVNNKRCPMCNKRLVHKLDSLGYNVSDSIKIWSDKNIKSVYEVSLSGQNKYWWKCSNGKHKDYKRTIDNSIKCGFRCPQCVAERTESIIQEKVRLYLQSLGYIINTEYQCTIIPKNPKNGHGMPFDNEVLDFKLIVETNGEQHYFIRESSPWLKNQTPEQYLHQRKLYDRYKKFIAISQGYFYLEIPYTAFDSNDTYKQMIDNKIQQILKDSE